MTRIALGLFALALLWPASAGVGADLPGYLLDEPGIVPITAEA